MGVTFLKVRMFNPAHPKKSRVLRFLVDSGAVDSVVPEEVLKEMGIKPTSQREFILADGEMITKAIGNAHFEYKGVIGAAPVVFGDKGIFLLGATTIEALGMILDPLHRELKPLPMVMM